MTEGRKDDAGKARFDLVPPVAMMELAELFTTGADIYGDRNWEAGMSWGRVFSALMRHAWRWWGGQRLDPKDRQHHLISVAWCAIVLFEFERRKAGTDDRSVYDKPGDGEPSETDKRISRTIEDYQTTYRGHDDTRARKAQAERDE